MGTESPTTGLRLRIQTYYLLPGKRLEPLSWSLYASVVCPAEAFRYVKELAIDSDPAESMRLGRSCGPLDELLPRFRHLADEKNKRASLRLTAAGSSPLAGKPDKHICAG